MNKFDYSPKHRVATEAEVQEVRCLVKSCIMTRKGGMPVAELRDEFTYLTGMDEIPYSKLGYNSLLHFLRDCPGIRSSRNEVGVPVLVVNETQQTKHLVQMIKNQKDPKTNRLSYKRSRRSNSRRRHDRESREKILDQRRNIQEEEEKEESIDSHQLVVEPPIDENIDRPIIYTEYHFEEKMSVCTEPLVGNTHQLMGDDYFLQLAIKYLHYDLQRKTLKSPITCGTVQSGMTISKACKRLDNIKTMSNRLVINLGTVDIYKRYTDIEMQEDMLQLLRKLKTKFGYSAQQITLCTLPPMGNVSIFGEREKYLNLQSFNNWLRNFTQKCGYNLLDFYNEFINGENRCIDYQYFQQDARMVSGTAHPHVLWNYYGRQKALKLLLNLK